MLTFGRQHRATAGAHCRNTNSALYSVYSTGSVNEEDIKYLLEEINAAQANSSDQVALQALYDEVVKYDSFNLRTRNDQNLCS